MRQRKIGSVLESADGENSAGLIPETGKVFPRMEVQLVSPQLLVLGLGSSRLRKKHFCVAV